MMLKKENQKCRTKCQQYFLITREQNKIPTDYQRLEGASKLHKPKQTENCSQCDYLKRSLRKFLVYQRKDPKTWGGRNAVHYEWSTLPLSYAPQENLEDTNLIKEFRNINVEGNESIFEKCYGVHSL